VKAFPDILILVIVLIYNQNIEMHRLFGKSKPKAEAPSLDSTSSTIGSRVTDRMCLFVSFFGDLLIELLLFTLLFMQLIPRLRVWIMN